MEIDRYNVRIRLGVEAPKDVPVFREELLPVKKPATENPK